MRKISYIILSFAVCAAVVLGAGNPAIADNTNVVVNGKAVAFTDGKPYVDKQSGRMYVPLRAIGEALGASVTWDQNAGTAMLSIGDSASISAKVDSSEVHSKDRTIVTDAPVRMAGGRVMAPLRVFSEALGAQVTWKQDENTVEIVLNPPAAGQQPPTEAPVEHSGIQVVVNGSPVASSDGKSLTAEHNGRIYVAVKDLAGAMKFGMNWDPKKQFILLYNRPASKNETINGVTSYEKQKEIYFGMNIGSSAITSGGEKTPIDAPVMLADGRVMAPLHGFPEALGAKTAWSKDGGTVSITYNEPEFMKWQGTIPWELYSVRKLIPGHPNISVGWTNSASISSGTGYVLAYEYNAFHLQVSTRDPVRLNEVKEILKVFFPKSYNTAYQYLIDTQKSKNNRAALDGREMTTSAELSCGRMQISGQGGKVAR